MRLANKWELGRRSVCRNYEKNRSLQKETNLCYVHLSALGAESMRLRELCRVADMSMEEFKKCFE